jgi:hypothetical protein
LTAQVWGLAACCLPLAILLLLLAIVPLLLGIAFALLAPGAADTTASPRESA